MTEMLERKEEIGETNYLGSKGDKGSQVSIVILPVNYNFMVERIIISR